MPVISRDEIKEGYVNTFGVKHDQLPLDTDGFVSNLALVYGQTTNTNVSLEVFCSI